MIVNKNMIFGIPLLAVCVIAIVIIGTHSLSYSHRFAKEDPYRVWMAALKEFVGPAYYLGSEAEFSYFRVGDILCESFKVRTAECALPRTFQFGKEKPYRITFSMVPENYRETK